MQDATSKIWPEQTPAAMREALTARFDATVEQVTVISRGYTPNLRLVLRLRDRPGVFVKIATTLMMADWLRAERYICEHLDAPYMPRYEGWLEDAKTPALLLEDLTAAQRPPPWQRREVDAVCAALADLHSRAPLPGLPRFEDTYMRGGWSLLADSPEPFLALNLCSPAWLENALPALIAAENDAALHGDQLAHIDVRSDNRCFREGKAVIIDWNHTCLANGLVDLAAWAPSLHAEGGPAPEEILPDQPGLAAFVCSFFALRAGQPDPWPGSRIRHVQRQQLSTAFPWTIRALGLPPPL